MAQWGQGFQYPLQTGFNPQQPQQQFQPGLQPGGILPQQTGFPGARPGFQQPQPTGYSGPQPPPQHGGFGLQPTGFQPQPTGFQPSLQAQPTGFQTQSAFQRRPPPPPPPVPSIPLQFQQNAGQGSGFLGAPQNATRSFLSPSPGPLTAQPTGFAGGMQPLVPQVTGFIDPRLQMMSSSFLPANPSMPYNPAGAPQLQQQLGLSLQQSFQQHNQQQRGTAAPRVPWTLSKAEKKSYDQIFRAWDTRGEGFITGQTALEVFEQSGLDKNELAKIWGLADADNRGKLSLPEFYVAMGLIYRRLNGNEVPEELPPELVPPSHRDLDESVNFIKDILKNDTRARSPGTFDSGPVSKLKERSFNNTSAPGAGGRQDATVYKYKDDTPAGGFYQSRARHVDRSAIRTASDSHSPASDLSDLKRQLDSTSKMLDVSREEESSRTAEDEELAREMSDLKYRVRRLQEDLDYNSKGPRTVAKDEERRRLERELLTIRHEKMPDLERRIEDREERKKREQREWNRERDKRNERFGRYDDRDDYRSSSRYGRDDDYDRDRGYNSYDRDERDRDRDRDYDYDRDRRDRDRDYGRDSDRDRPYSRNRDRDRDYGRARSPPAARSPPPPPPAAPESSISRPPPAPTPAKSPAPALKSMTPEERKAFMQAQAQQRIQERMAALGVTPVAGASPKLDTSVEDRLAKEKKEAEEKAKAAEREAEERVKLRQERLQSEKALKEGPTTPTTLISTAPPAVTPAPAPTLPKPTPLAVKARAPAPPPPRKTPSARPPIAARTPSVPTLTPPAPPAPAPAPPPPVSAIPEVDPQEEEFRAREAALRKAREERLERLRRMEEEEAEAAKRLEEEYQARRKQFMSPPVATTPLAPPAPATPATAPPPPPPPAPPVQAPPPPAPPVPVVAPAPPTPPIAPPAVALASPPPPPAPAPPVASPPVASTNPFSRMMKEGSTPGATSPAVTANGSTNPFFKSQTASPPMPTTAPSVSSPVRASYHTAPESESDWDDAEEKDLDEDSEDELDSSRDTRNRLAQHLFGNILPPSRPQSVAPAQASSQPATPAPPAPPAPPSAPPAPEAAPAAPAPPPPPAAPAAPPPPAIAAPAPTGDRSALLGAIQSGARLRKAATNDRSAAALSGKVLGDAAPPPHVQATPRAPSPPTPAPATSGLDPSLLPTELPLMAPTSSNRESVGWFADLAANQTQGTSQHEYLPSMSEENEEEQATIPQIQVDVPQEHNPMSDVDMSVEYRVRSLYAYEGQRAEDLSFGENLILSAHPSKSGAEWWYGTLMRDGKNGFFPKTYVEKVEIARAKALFSYEGSNPDELPFADGDELTIVDHGDADWWKAEQSGVVFIVPAAYLELVDAATVTPRPHPMDPLVAPLVQARSSALPTIPPSISDNVDKEDDDDESEDTDSDWASDDSEDEDFVTASETESSDDESQEGQTEEQPRAEREARAIERQRVLEAAGLIITKSDRKPPPRPARRKSTSKRRPAPAVPQSHKHASSPEPESKDSSLRLDDAYDRYEAFKKSNASMNRLSLASIDTTISVTSSTPSPAPSLNNLRNLSAEQESKPYSHFLHFFSRGRTPTVDGDTNRPVISGPIPIGEGGPSMLTTSVDQEFGTSWASLIDKSALEGIPATERRRQEAIFEFIATEAAYVRDLQLIVEVFYANLLPLLDQKAITVIFANVEDILLTNTTFLSSLEERQKECRLYIDNIGDLFRANMADMGIYTEYCTNQGTAIKVLQSLRQSDSELAACLQRLRDDAAVRNLDLSSYLLVPMQRITRYPLLIKQVLHYSEVAEERAQIEAALQIAEKILHHINESIRELEGRERLRNISDNLWIGEGRLDLTASTRYMGERKLLKEGLLMKSKSGRRLRAFLCSDILVLTDEGAKTLYRVPIPLSGIQVKEVSGRRDDLAFQIALAYPRGGDKINLKATSARDCQLWMQALEKASHRCREAEKRAAQRR